MDDVGSENHSNEFREEVGNPFLDEVAVEAAEIELAKQCALEKKSEAASESLTKTESVGRQDANLSEKRQEAPEVKEVSEVTEATTESLEEISAISQADRQQDSSKTSENAGSSEIKKIKPFIPCKVKSWLIRIAVILIIAMFIRWIILHFNHLKEKTTVKPVPVVLGVAKKMDMPVYVLALGTVTPLDTVIVKTQINGLLQKVLFLEGQRVNAGDVLAEIDPRPYEAQLEQFQGQLARDEALLANAKIDLERYEKLFSQDSVSQQTLETQRWLVKQLEGTIKLDQGQIDAVKVNLIYTRIISPIDGQVGLRLVDPGNFVQTTDTTGLVVINTIQPITVVFAIPEDNLPQVLQQNDGGKGLIVEAYDRTQNKLLAIGTVLTVDNQIDPSTGTVKIKAKFLNEEKTLFPNQFVNIKLKVSTLQDATVVPKEALQYGAKGNFVFVVNKKDEQLRVNVKPVVVSTTVKNEAAIIGDVLPDQEVVVEGADKLNEETIIKSEPRNNQTLSSLSQGFEWRNIEDAREKG